ncbi:MAG TPA: amidohydrolase [Prolixibacteraceae bacterium]|nr:amidohydrolase [Prolixibacteraceae bacterium]
MQEELTFAMIQFNPVWEKIEDNLVQINRLLNKLQKPVDVIVLPEAFATGFSMNAPEISQTMNGSIVEWMLQTAQKYNAALAGSVFINENNIFYNRFIWALPNRDIATYNKRHLFSMGAEHTAYSNGNQQLIIDYKGWKFFPQICYDLRFPVWSRNTFNYDVLINVANWPAARNSVWETLLKARAIENQCYAIGVNRIGTDGNNIEHIGNSLAINYKGETIAKMGNNTAIEIVTLSKATRNAFVEKFNALNDTDSFELDFD